MRDRDLIRHYWPVELRPAFDALFGIDDALGQVVASTSQPALGAIRLAWWREALERLDHSPPPPEPRLQAVAEDLLRRGISGAEVGALESGWAAWLDEEPDLDAVAARGETLFALAARLLNSKDPRLGEAGRLFALGDAARRGLRLPATPGLGGHHFPHALRPLTALAKLAVRDLRDGKRLEPEATPARAAALLAHRLFGTVA
ncbi:hypothetical protein [Sphingomonas sp.]|uniref:hypothetical protein n=1 Tax=Sphingomonas sp. TaxID=28214 RepID=UPI00286C6B75|nr:hypothetical protein [Sphingomonas sp.]